MKTNNSSQKEIYHGLCRTTDLRMHHLVLSFFFSLREHKDLKTKEGCSMILCIP